MIGRWRSFKIRREVVYVTQAYIDWGDNICKEAFFKIFVLKTKKDKEG